jgi:adenylate cyclase
MESGHTVRKLAAILHADVVGYSRLMGEDEAATLQTLSAYSEVMDNLVELYHGRVVGTAGDSVLAEFISVVDALQCAIETQRELKSRNAVLPDSRKMEFRNGINLGDVIVEDDDIYGDGVNVAARLEQLAEPGGICISRSARDQVRDKLPFLLEDIGEQSVKNIVRPVRAFRVQIEPGAAAPGSVKKAVLWHWRWAAVIAAVAVVPGGGFAVWQLERIPSAPTSQATVAQPVGGKTSIAVLPFVNMSANSTDDDFSDGITKDIITVLA